MQFTWVTLRYCTSEILHSSYLLWKSLWWEVCLRKCMGRGMFLHFWRCHSNWLCIIRHTKCVGIWISWEVKFMEVANLRKLNSFWNRPEEMLAHVILFCCQFLNLTLLTLYGTCIPQVQSSNCDFELLTLDTGDLPVALQIKPSRLWEKKSLTVLLHRKEIQLYVE